MEHVKRLHENATKLLKIYTDETDLFEIGPLLKVLEKDLSYLSGHHASGSQASPASATGRPRSLPGGWEPEQEVQEDVPIEPPLISCKDGVMREFDLSESKYRAAFVIDSNSLRR